MPNTTWAMIENSGLIPHVEEAAIKSSYRYGGMTNTVKMVSDMTGWNVRKVAEWLGTRRARELAEATDIPTTVIQRRRKAQISPKEVGDSYPITDRRTQTDIEDALAEAAAKLSYSLAAQREADLIETALSVFEGGAYNGSTAVFDWNKAIDASYELSVRNGLEQTLYVAVHPFAVRDTMKSLLAAGATQALEDFAGKAINGWRIPAFGNTVIYSNPFIPRRVTYTLDFSALTAGDKFRLEVLTDREVGLSITAEITYSTTPATLVTNIKTALEALTFADNGTWAVSGAAVTAIEITPPVLLDVESELRMATNPATGELYTNSDVVVIREKTATASALMYLSDALIYDQRSMPKMYYEQLNQGRTVKMSMYEVYGVGAWRPELGMTYSHLCKSSLATA